MAIAFLFFLSISGAAFSSPVLINGTGIFLTTGDSWDFYQGYTLTVTSVNLEQKQAWVKLLHDDELLKEQILSEKDSLVYSKNEEILNITLDTIYISPGGELITFKPVYQYQDMDLPEPAVEDDNSVIGKDNESQISGDNDVGGQTDGFTIIQAVACLSLITILTKLIKKEK